MVRPARVAQALGMRIALSAMIVCISTVASAAGNLRDGDAVLDQDALSAMISGQVIEFFDGSKSTYQIDGGYGYTYTDDGPVWSGRYLVGDNSDVCVTFENGSKRCDTFVLDERRFILITADGLRFPVRNITVAKP